MIGNVADAQDLTQEVFIKALQRKDQIKDLAKANHWLSRIATNTTIDYMRRHGRVTFCEIDDVQEPIINPASESPEHQVLRSERESYMEDGLRLLTERERTALIMRDVEDMPADEVAQAHELFESNGALAHRECTHQVPALPGTEEAMTHPVPQQLALFAGGDLAAWSNWRVARHLHQCQDCSSEVAAYRGAAQDIEQLRELPADLDWEDLAMEMKANIRLGLAAGECVEQETVGPGIFGWRLVAVMASVLVLMASGWLLHMPFSQSSRRK